MIDNARYLGEEHRHKEREYGLKWRAAYKLELKSMVGDLSLKYGNPIEASMHWNGDLSEQIYYTINKNWADVTLHMAGKNLEALQLLTPSLEDFEKICSTLRKYLKIRDLPTVLAAEKDKAKLEKEREAKVKAEAEAKAELFFKQEAERQKAMEVAEAKLKAESDPHSKNNNPMTPSTVQATPDPLTEDGQKVLEMLKTVPAGIAEDAASLKLWLASKVLTVANFHEQWQGNEPIFHDDATFQEWTNG